MKPILILLLILGIAGGIMMMAVRTDPLEWTTESDEARQELELGLQSVMKYYTKDAVEHFERAVELDPDFAAAKLFLAQMEPSWERREALQKEVRSLDLSGATEREIFLRDFHVARWDRKTDLAHSLAEEYARDHPDDPHGMANVAQLYWEEQNWEKAEEAYREILEIDPNWVQAQNRLGYIALAQGRFDEAEELFDTYTYIAPDQANPHDSMGELLVLSGRYDEALAQFERALKFRPDFCTAYEHMIDGVLMAGTPDLGGPILDRAAKHCPSRMISALRCGILLWQDYMEGDVEAIWSAAREDCRRQVGEFNFLTHRAAAMTGRLKIARNTERDLEMRIVAAEEAEHLRLDHPRALLNHMKGTRLLIEGDFEGAATALAAADELLLYWGEGQGILKLLNQMNLARAYERLGRRSEFEDTLARIAAVNPAFAELYPEAVSGL